MKNIKALIKNNEVIAYLFFGILTTIVSWISFALINILLKMFINDYLAVVTVSNVISWFFAVLFAFITNKLWVFNSKSFKSNVVVSELLKFISGRIVTGIIEIVAVPFLIKSGLNGALFGVEGMLAKIIVSIIVIVLNYLFSKVFIFKKGNEK